MFYRSDRRRVGLYTVLVATIAGVGVGLLGVHMATSGIGPGVAEAHARLALLGFLGLTVVGVSYQFYPPSIASSRWIGDRTAAVAVLCLAVGVLLDAGGSLAGHGGVLSAGRILMLVGALVHAVVLLFVFAERW